MSVTIYIPRDSGALALGADKVAKAIEVEINNRALDIKIVRNGSRGAYFLGYCLCLGGCDVRHIRAKRKTRR